MMKKIIGSIALTAAVVAMTAPLNAQVIEDFESYADTAALTAVWGEGVNTTLEIAAENSPSSAGSQSMKIIGSIPEVLWSTCTANGPIQGSALNFTDKVLGFSVKADGAVETAAPGYKDFFIYFYEAGAESTNFGRAAADASAFTAGWSDLTVDPSALSKPWNAAALPDITNISKIDIVVYAQGDPAVPAYTCEFLVDDLTVQDPPAPPAPEVVYTVTETASAPTIDGTIGAGEWDAAGTGCTDFTIIATDTPAPEAVTVKALWDATNLYILWTGPNADLGRTDNPAGNDIRPDGDAENIILFPNGPNASEYYRIILAPNPTSGVMYTATNAYDSAGLIGDNSDPAYWNMWTPTITGAFDYTAGILTMEISIPWADFNYYPATKDGLPTNGDMWGCQLADSNDGGNYAWSECTATNYIGVNPKNGWQFGDTSDVTSWTLFD